MERSIDVTDLYPDSITLGCDHILPFGSVLEKMLLTYVMFFLSANSEAHMELFDSSSPPSCFLLNKIL